VIKDGSGLRSTNGKELNKHARNKEKGEKCHSTWEGRVRRTGFGAKMRKRTEEERRGHRNVAKTRLRVKRPEV